MGLFTVILYMFLGIAIRYITADECGLRRSPNRIVGGRDAYLGQFPWIVRLKIRDQFRCGGTIIAPRYVLTAAHCVKAEIEFVRVGDNFGRNPDCEGNVCAPKVQDIKIKNGFKHPQFDLSRRINDIGILELAKDIEYNEFVQPACLLDTNKKVVTGRVEVAGWGHVDSIGTIINHLQYVNLPVQPYEVCMKVYNLSRRHSDTQYCVGDFNGMDSCKGDSGGPMTKEVRHEGQRRNYVVGVVSYGRISCGEVPGIYMDVAFYRNWIQNIITSSTSSSKISQDTQTSTSTPVVPNPQMSADHLPSGLDVRRGNQDGSPRAQGPHTFGASTNFGF